VAPGEGQVLPALQEGPINGQEDARREDGRGGEYINKESKREDIGLIAHELQEIYPFLVNGEKDGHEYQSVNYIGLIGILIKEIQDLKKRIVILEQKL
jgi:hypothetical protein